MSNEVDRRRFLTYSGVASASAAGLWVAPSIIGTSSAFAVGSCVTFGALTWSSVTGGPYAPSTSSTVTFTVQVPGTGGAPDIHVVVTVAPVGTPGSGSGGVDVGSPFNGYTSFYKLAMTNSAVAVGYDVSFAFYSGTTGTTPIDVYHLAFKVIDIDRAGTGGGGGFNDQVWLTSGFSTVSRGSEVGGTGISTDPWRGTSSAGVTDDTGTVSVDYAGPVSATTVSYRSSQFTGWAQDIAIGNLSWCY